MNLRILQRPIFRFIKSNSVSFNTKNLVRNYAFKSELKIKWVRPEKISCIKPEKSGDLEVFKQVDKADYPLELRGAKELENAEDIIKKLFSLKYAPLKQSLFVARQEMIDSVRRHPHDQGSIEVKIAAMTVKIRYMQNIMEQFPRNSVLKVALKELIDKRKKYFKYLRRWDYKRFEWLLEKIGVVYKPPPDEFHWITRKESLQKLTDKYCEDLKNDRLAAYRKELEAQQEGFLRDKIKKLEFIRNEQEACGIEVTIKQTDIDSAKKQLENLLIERSTTVNIKV